MHSFLRAARSLVPSFALVPLVFVVTACAEGGSRDRPQTEIRVAASHQMFAFAGRPVFGKFPVEPGFVFNDRGTIVLQDDATYTVQRQTGTSSPQSYSIANTGEFNITVPVASRRAPTHYLGAYLVEGKSKVYFFTDRFAPSSTSSLGLFWGTRFVAGTPDLQGDWHLFSQHVIFAQSASPDPDNVGRSVGGTLTIDDKGKVTAGSGKESTKAALTFAGTTESFANGAVTLTLDYTEGTKKDSRVFRAGLSGDVLLGIDEDESDGESGLIALVRKRTTDAELKDLAGKYIVGLHTIFVNPVRSGIDAALGTLTFNDQGGFQLEAIGVKNGGPKPFSYSGSATLAKDGTLTLTVGGTNETWMGAVDQEYKVLVIVDNFVETRSGTEPPELNLLLGIRESAAQ